MNEIMYLTGLELKLCARNIINGCQGRTIQRVEGSVGNVSLCFNNFSTCRFYAGSYITPGKMEPLDDIDIPIAEGVRVGLCDFTWRKVLYHPLRY